MEPVRRDAPARVRVAWLDIARGAGAVLVVFGHVWRGLLEAGVLAPGPLFATVDQGLYLFHMPLFFLLSGLVFPPSIRRSPGTFLADRAWRLLYPMTVWTYMMIGLRLLAPGGVNHAMTLDDLLRLPLPPFELFWFVWALFVIQLTAYPILRHAGRFGPLALAGLAILFLFTGPGYPALQPWIGAAMRNLTYFALGVLAAGLAPAAARIGIRGALLGVGTLALCIAVDHVLAPGGSARALLAGLAACGFAALVAGLVGAPSGPAEQGRAGRALSAVGQGAMAVFLTHVIFAAATRVGLLALGVDDLAVHAVLGTLAGIAGPLLALAIARRLRLDRLAGF